MPSWMAPFRADDVVYRKRETKDGKQYFIPVTSAVSVTNLRHLVKGIPKLILEYEHQTPSAAVLVGVSPSHPTPANLLVGGLSRGGLNTPVSYSLLHTLSCA